MSRRTIAAVFLVALFLRLTLVAVVPDAPLKADAVEYDTIALNLTQGRGFSIQDGEPTALRSFSYPAFLAVVYYFAGHDLDWVRRVQALLGAVICVMTCLIAGRLFDGTTATLSGWICAVYPPLIVPTADILTEILFIFFMVLAVYAIISKQAAAWRFGAGVVLGLALMTRPILFLFFPFLFAWLIFFEKRRPVVSSIALLGGVLLMILPWIYRNWEQLGAFIPMTTNGGVSLYNSYFLPHQGFGFNGAELADGVYMQLSNEVSRDQYLTRKTLEFIFNNPMEVVRLTFLKALFLLYPFDGYWYALSFGSKFNIFWGGLLSLSVIGIRMSVHRSNPGIKLVWFLSIALILAMLFFHALPRYRLPIEPFLICFAAAAIRSVWRQKRAVAVSLIGINFALFLCFRFTRLEQFFGYLKQLL